MYQAIRDIVTALINLAPAFQSRRNATRMNKLGAALFDVPVRGYAIVQRGEEIVTMLEAIREVYAEREAWWQRHRELRAQGSTQPYPDSGRWPILFQNLEGQRTDLERFLADVQDVWRHLTLIDPTTYPRAVFVARGKFQNLAVLGEIINSLDSGALDVEHGPLPAIPEQEPGCRLLEALGYRPTGYPRTPLTPVALPRAWDPAAHTGLSREAVERFFGQIDTYLSHAQPRQVLVSLRECLDHLHARLGETFDVKDVLLHLEQLNRRRGLEL
ncbi:hypothetical protein [Streptomyces sp. NPDC002172]